MQGIFDESSRRPLPQGPRLEDHRTAVIRGALGAIPVLGNVLAEELGLVLVGPLSRRRDEWLADLARRLKDLENKVDGFRFEDLSSNEQFVSATAQATQAALRTHQREKLKALQNAVLNTALGRAPDDSVQTIFLNLVERLTPLHLAILNTLRNPPALRPQTGEYLAWQQHWYTQQQYPNQFRNPPPEPIRFIKEFTPTLRDQANEFVRLLMRDLHSSGLSPINPEDTYLQQVSLTDLGGQFFSYITAPEEEHE